MKVNPRAYESELKALFKEIFSETDFFTNIIFSEKLLSSHCFVKKEDGQIVSFLYAIEKNMRIKESLEKCIYIYGVGTKTSFRNKGLSKSLLEEVYNYFKNKNIKFLYLVPASGNLFSMYEKSGYKTAFYLNKKTVSLDKSDNIIPENGDYYLDYCDYSKKFDNIIFLSEKDAKITLKYAKYVKINKSGFLYEEANDEVFIRECFIADNHDLELFLYYLGNKFKTAHITTSGSSVPYAMIKPYENFSLQGTRYTNMNFD